MNLLSSSFAVTFFARFFLILAANALLCAAPLVQTSEAGTVREPAGAPLFDPDHQKPIRARDGSLTLELHKSGDSLSVVVLSQGGLSSKIQLPDLMTQVDEIRLVHTGRVVVLGWSNGSVSAAAVLDASAGTVEDSFRMYAPKLSPDGRYIAFVKFFSSHFANNPTDDYLVYDLTQDAHANRRGGVSLDDTTDVGTPVFPPGFANTVADNVGGEDQGQHMMASDSFYWTPDARRFVFADQNESDRRTGRLTIVGVTIDGNSASTRSIAIPVFGICPIGGAECSLQASHFRLGGNGITFQVTSPNGAGTIRQEMHLRWSDLR